MEECLFVFFFLSTWQVLQKDTGGHFLACNISDLLETVAWRSWFANCSSAVCNFKLFLTLGCNFSFIDFAFVCVSAKE